jgi:hypothetical protein
LSVNKTLVRSHQAFGRILAGPQSQILAGAPLRLRFCSIGPSKSTSKSCAIPEKLIYGQLFGQAGGNYPGKNSLACRFGLRGSLSKAPGRNCSLTGRPPLSGFNPPH